MHVLMAIIKCISYFIRGQKLTTGSDEPVCVCVCVCVFVCMYVCVYIENSINKYKLSKELGWVMMFKIFLPFLSFLATSYMCISHSSTNTFC